MERPTGSTDLEDRLRSMIVHLHSEYGVLQRIAYKSKNQQRRSPYFQSLLKVRRDVRLLLESARIGEILNNLFPIIKGRRPAHKAYVPTRPNKDAPPKYNYMERLLGVARLLSEMTEPILMAAIQISLLLSKAFFKAFCTTTLALLARLRVLVQQILLDVVDVFNKVASVSRRKHSVKLNHHGVEAFREYAPTSKDDLTLDCVWNNDKFVLIERRESAEAGKKDEGKIPLRSESSIQYEAIDILGGGQSSGNDSLLENTNGLPSQSSLVRQELKANHFTDSLESYDEGKHRVAEKFNASEQKPALKRSESPYLLASSKSIKTEKESAKKVAFIKVGKPKDNEMSSTKQTKKRKLDMPLKDDNQPRDPFLDLLTAGSMNTTLS